MELDDFFESKSKRHGNYQEHGYHDEDRDSQQPYRSYQANYQYNEHGTWAIILKKITVNKKLKVLVVLAGILIVILAISLFIVFLPIIMKLFDYISKNGVQGILDGIGNFLDKIWKGSGK